MKKRISRVLNFFAFNLLFFALYLNFVHKDKNIQAAAPTSKNVASIKGTVLVTNPEQYLKMQIKNEPTVTAQLRN